MRHEPSVEPFHQSTARAQMSFDQGTVLQSGCSAGIPSCPSQSSLGCEAATKCIKGRRRRSLPKQGSLTLTTAALSDMIFEQTNSQPPNLRPLPIVPADTRFSNPHPQLLPIQLCIWQLAPRRGKKIAPVLFQSVTPFLCAPSKYGCEKGALGCGVWSTFIDNIILGKRRIAANPSSPATATRVRQKRSVCAEMRPVSDCCTLLGRNLYPHPGVPGNLIFHLNCRRCDVKPST
jgi:hypothetical protein